MARFLKAALKGVVTDGQLDKIESGIDVVGDIAVLRLNDSMRSIESDVGQAVLRGMKNVKVVLSQEGPVEGEFRLRKLRHLAGEKRTTTTHKENNLRFRVDLQTCYFSPRLSTERLRVAEAVKDDDRVLNMFAGVGPFSITVARCRRAEVWSNELNRAAYDFHIANNALNKVGDRISMLNRDARMLPQEIEGRFDIIIMPHPSGAREYLPAAARLLKPGGTVYYYRHVSARDEAEAGALLTDEARSVLGAAAEVNVRKVRAVGPRLLEIVAEASAG